MVLGKAASVSPRYLVDRQMSGPHSGLTHQISWVGVDRLCFFQVLLIMQQTNIGELSLCENGSELLNHHWPL